MRFPVGSVEAGSESVTLSLLSLNLPLPWERFRLVPISRATPTTCKWRWRSRRLDAWFWPRRAPRAARCAETVRLACV